MSKYKIYPPLGIARVGNAPVDFYIGPESYRGLPIKPNGGDFTDRDFRDAEGRLCRQAARFHIYDEKGHEVTLKTAEVKDIQWTVHMANKKASWYEFKTNEGEHGYASNHPLRNPEIEDRHSLIIDPGPRQIGGADAGPVHMDKNSIPDGYQGGHFPSDLLYPSKEHISTLGELRTDEEGRLLVLGGLGVSGSTDDPPVITHYANNDHWWDDIGDGPVRAVITWNDGRTDEVEVAWVSVAPPAYAPELPNLVTLWDTMFDAAVRNNHFQNIYHQEMWKSGKNGYKPSFESEIRPLLERAALYTWVAAIPPKPHSFNMEMLGAVPEEKSMDAHIGLRKWILDVLRPPSSENVIVSERGTTMMPYLAGDNCLIGDTLTSKYLRLTDTQYFFLQQWADGHFVNESPSVSEPDAITRAVLDNCVGGAFSPGIEVTWISRNPAIYQKHDPFRINAAAPKNGPLHLGFNPKAMEPGDLTRYMALPWQADFNECSSQPIDGRRLWWWPSQRPEFVYVDPNKDQQLESASHTPPIPDDETGIQVPWIGTGFDQNRSDFIAFANDLHMVEHWYELGFVMEKGNEGEDLYVEVARTLPRPFYPSPPDNDGC